MGTSFPYLSNLLVRIDPSTKLDPESKNNTNNRYNMKGFLARFTLIKSRTAPAGVEFEIVYDQTDGFLNSLTDFQHLIDAGIITGRGTYTVPGYEPKVKIKEVKQLYLEDEDFKNTLTELAEEYYATLVPRSSNFVATEMPVRTIDLDDGRVLELIEEDEVGGIWKQRGSSDGKFYDDKGEEIQVEFE